MVLRDADHHCVVHQRTLRDQPLPAVDRAQQPVGDAVRVNRLRRDVADGGRLRRAEVDMRVARQQDAVLAAQQDGRFRPDRGSVIQFLKVAQPERPEDQAQQLAIGTCDLAGDVSGPLSVASVQQRLADENGSPRVVPQPHEVVPIGNIDLGARNGNGGVDQVAT